MRCRLHFLAFSVLLFINICPAASLNKARSTVTNLTTVKYEPAVSISTKNVADKIKITVGDNGNGITQSVIDKIFQPFFTTKPTGQGTGLGLSLAYDIVKAHVGELKVKTKENKVSEFTISLSH